jgi:drug/metabolite transporter (DMT)-like permease
MGYLPFIVLILGATLIAFAPIFVRLSETGPTATAFWRLLLAMPLLLPLGLCAARTTPPIKQAPFAWWLFLPGVFFACDLALWHAAILKTGVAHATLLANCAPPFVCLGAWLLLGEKPGARFVFGAGLTLLGIAAISLCAPEGAGAQVPRHSLAGDALAVAAAVLYACYQLSVKILRQSVSGWRILACSAASGALTLLCIGILEGERAWLPLTAHGWLILIAMGVVVQVCGQGSIVWALAHLPASFSSLSLLWQPVFATVLAWWLFGEWLTPVQLLGAALVLVGISMARAVVTHPPTKTSVLLSKG